MKQVKADTVVSAENAVRDTKNWLAVFKTEYDVPDEAVKILHQKLDQISDNMRGLKCTPKGADADSIRPVSNALRDLKSWLATFAQEYKLPAEAVKVLHENMDKIGQRLALIECK
ncbi:Uncharacterised protein [uncultured archaeon]|nr:Uncharacterised protein [uncultured archaeon]